MTETMTAEAFAALAREVQQLRDRNEILDAMARYTRGADRRSGIHRAFYGRLYRTGHSGVTLRG